MGGRSNFDLLRVGPALLRLCQIHPSELPRNVFDQELLPVGSKQADPEMATIRRRLGVPRQMVGRRILGQQNPDCAHISHRCRW